MRPLYGASALRPFCKSHHSLPQVDVRTRRCLLRTESDADIYSYSWTLLHAH